MERDAGVISLIKSLGYKKSECLVTCTCDELPCPLLTWLVSEIRTSCPDVPAANRIGGAVLVGELREVLKELSCPQSELTSAHLSPHLLNTVTEFLVSELTAARILTYKESRPEETEQNCESKEQRKEDGFAVDDEDPNISEAEEYKTDWKEVNKELAEVFQNLGLNESSQLKDACEEVKSRLAALPNGEVQEALLKTSLNSEQWKRIHEINKALRIDYKCRRKMMINRFHVTLLSFTWGERGPERNAVLRSVKPLEPSYESSVSIATLLAAREDQSRISPVKAGPSTSVHKMRMGDVPDRGGRPGEIEPPMPSFTSRSEGGGRNQYKKSRREYSGKKKNKKN